MAKILPVLLALVTNVAAQLSLRKAMMHTEVKVINLELIKEIASSFYLWVGLSCYIVSFALYLYILSKFEVSYIYPVIMSAGFVLLLVFSTLFLGEVINLKKIIGILVIMGGLFIISS